MNAQHMIQCRKLNKQLPALTTPPIPGELGQKVLNNISAEAWQMWLGRQIMLINEYRLNLSDTKAQAFLLDAMKKYLFDDQEILPSDYQPMDED